MYGNFKGLNDFTDRLRIGLEQLVLLIRIGAFRFTKEDKKELFWKAHLIADHDRRRSIHPQLFQTKKLDYQLPWLSSVAIEDAYDEIELLGFPLCSRFDLLKGQLPPSILAVDLPGHAGKRVTICGSVVTAKRVPLENGRNMYFATFLDGSGDVFDTVHFPDSVQKSFMAGREVYAVTGRVADELGYCSVTAEWIEMVERQGDPRYFGVGVPHKQIS